MSGIGGVARSLRPWAVDLLHCPDCGSGLALDDEVPSDGGGIAEGILRCSSVACRRAYPIRRGVPRLLPSHLVLERSGAEDVDASKDGGRLDTVKRETAAIFGYEWTEYARFGWDDGVYSLARERQVFLAKTLLGPEALEGKLVLDAGCGNGRYSYWAAELGARVLAVDIGDGVEAAAENLRDRDDVQVVQADLFHLPFDEHTFDLAFSIGVLMHTGDAREAFGAVARTVRPSGLLAAHLYGRGNVFYEIVDAAIRRVTTRLSLSGLRRFTRMAFGLRRALDRIGAGGVVARFVRLDPHPHCIFDWYAAPVATHHTLSEVLGWCRTSGLTVEASRPAREANGWSAFARRLAGGPGTVTVLARVGF